MQCGSFYLKEFIVPAGDEIVKIEELCLGYLGSYPTKGFKCVYKYPSPIEFSTCIEISGVHHHAIIESSSDLLASESPCQYFYACEGPVKIPYISSKNLNLKIGDFAVIRNIHPEKAKSIKIQPGNDSKTKPEIPKIIWPGMSIVTNNQTNHSVYGGIFSNVEYWKVLEINGNSNQKPYVYSKSLTKIDIFPSEPSRFSTNLYKIHSEKGILSKLSLKPTISHIISMSQQKCGFWLQSLRGCGKRAIVYKAASKLGYSIKEVSQYNFITLKDFSELLTSQKPYTILHIRQFPEAISLMSIGQPEIILKIRDILASYLNTESAQLIFLSSSNSSQLPNEIRNLFINITIKTPTAEDRLKIFQNFEINPSSNLILSTSGKTIEELIFITKSLKSGKNIEDVLKVFKTSGTGIPNVK